MRPSRYIFRMKSIGAIEVKKALTKSSVQNDEVVGARECVMRTSSANAVKNGLQTVEKMRAMSVSTAPTAEGMGSVGARRVLKRLHGVWGAALGVGTPPVRPVFAARTARGRPSSKWRRWRLNGSVSRSDLRSLSRPEIDVLAREIRDRLVVTCARNGGHLAPNLGVVELTLALHRVLDLPTDKIVWDVSHQTYVHKILTGRRERFATLRQSGGISGLHDARRVAVRRLRRRARLDGDLGGAGHGSCARSRGARNETIVAVIGDGALTGGLAYEAINNAGHLDSNFIVVLNDNEMSIAPNVGSISKYLGVLRSKPQFTLAREKTKDLLSAMPFGRDRALRALSTAEVAAMRFWSPDEKATVIFEEMGFRYIGPIDGHDYDALIDILSNSRKIAGPVLLHVRTVKGKGYTPAEIDSRTFHGCGAFEIENGKIEKKGGARPTFSDAFGAAMTTLGERDHRIIGVTAAMPDGTKLSVFAKRFPERFFDVGIAEAHALCFAAGAAAAGLRPVCAIYSTFAQRAYDQIVHDVVVQSLPVVLALDRAGFVGDDGPTHMGLYDIAYLRTLPNMTIMAPRCEDEVLPMLAHALTLDAPVGHPLSAGQQRRYAAAARRSHRARPRGGPAARRGRRDHRARHDGRRGACRVRSPWRRIGSSRPSSTRASSSRSTRSSSSSSRARIAG